MLQAFGPLDDDIQTKIKYAKWKATQIHKALCNGQQLAPTLLALRTEEEEVASQLTTPSPGEQPSAPPLNHTEPLLPSVPTEHQDDALHAKVHVIHTPDEAAPSAPSAPSAPLQEADCPLSVQDIAHVQKLSRWASSALDYEDIDTARKQLREALDILDSVAAQ